MDKGVSTDGLAGNIYSAPRTTKLGHPPNRRAGLPLPSEEAEPRSLGVTEGSALGPMMVGWRFGDSRTLRGMLLRDADGALASDPWPRSTWSVVPRTTSGARFGTSGSARTDGVLSAIELCDESIFSRDGLDRSFGSF